MSDLRIIKTQYSIKQALIVLLANKPFEKITVQDFVETAQINRSTFYDHYSGKSDLAGQMIDEFKHDYQGLINLRLQLKDKESLEQFVQEAMDFFYDKRRLLLALWQIKTKRHHLYEDMHLMLKKAFIELAKQRDTNKNWDYQATVWATLILTTAHYHLSQSNVVNAFSVLNDWEEIINIVRTS